MKSFAINVMPMCIVWLFNRCFIYLYINYFVDWIVMAWNVTIEPTIQPRYTVFCFSSTHTSIIMCTYFLCFRSHLIIFYSILRSFLSLRISPPNFVFFRVCLVWCGLVWLFFRANNTSDHTILLQVYAQICIWFLSILISFNTFNYNLFKYIRHTRTLQLYA